MGRGSSSLAALQKFTPMHVAGDGRGPVRFESPLGSMSEVVAGLATTSCCKSTGQVAVSPLDSLLVCRCPARHLACIRFVWGGM